MRKWNFELNLLEKVDNCASNHHKEWVSNNLISTKFGKGYSTLAIFISSISIFKFVTLDSNRTIGETSIWILVVLSTVISLVIGYIGWYALKNNISESTLVLFTAVPYTMCLIVAKMLLGGEFKIPYVLFGFFQGIIITIMFYVMGSSVSVRYQSNTSEEAIRAHLQTHLQNWYRVSQIIISIGIIGLLAVFTSVIPGANSTQGMSYLGILTSPIGVCLLPLLFFLWYKMQWIENEMKNI